MLQDDVSSIIPITLLIYERELSSFVSYIQKENIREKILKLTLIGMVLKEHKLNDVGIIYTLTKKIQFSNINIVEIASSFNEVHIIIKSEDLKNVIEALII